MSRCGRPASADRPSPTSCLRSPAAVCHRGLSLRCVATSPRTEAAALMLDLPVEPFGSIDRFDVTIDGAGQVAPDGWLVKGGGAAHARESGALHLDARHSAFS
ncbi:ribose-5-phosphate isomerase A [Streptomyces sp. NPDC059467]|uniref:ribose-5-phosphate isomerase A n=1 Tax=Streptomyces sp. NPDC059467 TaxID=3346844 RepID=UPI00367F7E26